MDNLVVSQTQAPLRAGDCPPPLSEAACVRLVRAHGSMVKATCQRILGDEALAEDAAQEVFLLLVRKLPSLPPQTILGGWLYVTACRVARTHQRAQIRRQHRENRPEAMENLINLGQDPLWRELEPLLDDGMMLLSDRQRELVLSHYFQHHSQRAAASLVGCSESVASRDLAAAVEKLRKFFRRRGVEVSAPLLAALLTAHGAEASIAIAGLSATLAAASAASTAPALGATFLFALMKTTTVTKVIAAAAAALLITSGARHYFTPRETPPTRPASRPAPASDRAPGTARPSSRPEKGARETLRLAAPLPVKDQSSGQYDEAALQSAREAQMKFFNRMGQLALMEDAMKVQEILLAEYGIRLSLEEIGQLQRGGQKGFTLGLTELWPLKQPQEALAWASSIYAGPIGPGVDLHQRILNGARKALPDLTRDGLNAMVPEGPGKGKMLDLLEASSEPAALAQRILSVPDSAERAARLKLLAQGWPDSEASADWARQNLSGTDKVTFYAQVGYNLAEQNPDAALRVLSELQGTEAYASTFSAMMRGLVQEGGRGQAAAELIEKATLDPGQRSELISELARRWVRSDADAAIAWVNTLTAPEDFRAAIPLLVSQLDKDRVVRTVDAALKNPDPVMELALIEAAAPASLVFDPERSRLILDPLISRDPALKLKSSEGSDSTKETLLWKSVNLAAKRQAEAGQPGAAMEWLGTLPFAGQSDYAQALGNVFSVWELKSARRPRRGFRIPVSIRP